MKTKQIHIKDGDYRTVLVPNRSNPLTVVINRKRWYRGNGPEGSKLRKAENGKMCCLGFDARALGFMAKDITGKSNPSDVTFNVPGLSSHGQDTKTCAAMMTINDDGVMQDTVRESKLKVLARRIGRKFVFKG